MALLAPWGRGEVLSPTVGAVPRHGIAADQRGRGCPAPTPDAGDVGVGARASLRNFCQLNRRRAVQALHPAQALDHAEMAAGVGQVNQQNIDDAVLPPVDVDAALL
jgi:hypothetical protein